MLKKIDRNIFLLGFISFCVFIFYLFYVNFSIDTIILFLSNKIFLGKWLAQGIFPWFNPHIYLGTPAAFDVGIGSFHPFNLFFIFPYPLSLALWMGATSLLFLSGFYLLFKKHTKTNLFALLLTLILFFSGSGMFRSNPTILLVIAHYGYFILSLYPLKNKSIKKYIFPIGMGVLMTISGHVQFVFYGYLLGILYTQLFRVVSFKKICGFFCLLFIATSWYFLFSLPLILDSTRLTTSKDYVTVGNNSLFQYVELFLPYLFGYIQNGSKWGPGSLYTTIISLFFTFTTGFAIWRQKLVVKLMFVIMIIASLGLINLPFFRGAGQVTVLIHILGLLYIAQEENYLFKTIFRHKRTKQTLMVFAVGSFVMGIFSSSEIFADLFLKGYTLLKHGQTSLFFDRQTVIAIGKLATLSFTHLFIFALAALYILKKRKIDALIIIYVAVEGICFAYFHSYFVPANILSKKDNLALSRTSNVYRIQTASDVVPYFGISTYMGDLIFRPPFSKEKALFDVKEEKSFQYLRNLFSYMPSTWIMTTSYNTVQGFNTFMLRSLAKEFEIPSEDYKTEYDYIIKRNALFADNKQMPSINSISSGHLTLNDLRWEKLGVRYFISDRPLKKYKLIEEKNGRYIYENEYTLPIYRITDEGIIITALPYYNDPNQWKFHIAKDDVGMKFQMVMNSGGFAAKLNGKEVPIQKEQFLLQIPLQSSGDLVVYYSPLLHFKEKVINPLYSRYEKIFSK